MDSVVAVSRGGKATEAAAHAHMLQQRNNQNNDMGRGNGHMVDDHRNGNVMQPGKQMNIKLSA